MRHFWKIFIQFLVISILFSLPLIFSSYFFELSVLCGIVITGLLIYGICDPAYWARRLLTWSIITYLGSRIPPPIIDFFSNKLLSDHVSQESLIAINSLIKWIYGENSEPAFLIVITLLFIYEVVRLTKDKFPSLFNTQHVSVIPDKTAGHIIISKDKRTIIILNRITITNNTEKEIKLTNAEMQLLRFKAFNVHLYNVINNDPDEISSERPKEIVTGETAILDITRHNPPRITSIFLYYFYYLRMDWFLTIESRLYLFGNEEIKNKNISLLFHKKYQ